MTLSEVAKLTEDQARAYLEGLRWPDGPWCPHCGGLDHPRLKGKKHRIGAIQCNDCRQQYTVTVGSVMESSKIPLAKWVLGFHLMCSSKKGISALQLQRELGLGSYRTAWFMEHRIRHAMKVEETVRLKGVVEIDETYVGGKPRYKGQSKAGHGTKKTPVFALVERDGNVKAKPVENVKAETLSREIRQNVDPEARLMTDEFKSYHKVRQEYEHESVTHGKGEYVRGDVHTNTIESWFALIKRGHYGVFHQMSKKHLSRYCDEFVFRWNNRKVSDAKRREQAIRQADGKRLTYKPA